MNLIKKIIAGFLGATLPLSVGAVFLGNSIKASKASAHTFVLNNNNAPEITNNQGTLEDEHYVTWEYNGVSDYNNGHIIINPQGYFGVKSDSNWGYTGIEGITANFSSGELWLLKSVDGITWNESAILESGVENNTADNWRYIRFYSYADTININSVSFGYSCSGVSSIEDVDNAKVGNVLSTSSNLSAEACAGRNTTAISFSKNNTSSSWAVIGLDREYTIEEIRYQVVEFDYYKVNTVPNTSVSFPAIQLYKDTTKTVGSKQSKEAGKTHYKVTDLGNDWYHVEMPVSALAPTLSGYYIYKLDTKTSTWKWMWDDAAVKTELTVGAIYLSVGTCIIDNLRFGSSLNELGVFNNGTSFDKYAEDEEGREIVKPYWFKVSWAGYFHSCTMTFSPAIAEQVVWDNTTSKSPFYVRGLQAGDVEVTATLVVGYDHHSLQITKTLTIN